jgi:hypothetical protein
MRATSHTIIKRVLCKEVLRIAYKESGLAEQIIAAEGGKENVHGEFGKAENWPEYQRRILDWLADSRNTSTLLDVISILSVGTEWHSSEEFRVVVPTQIKTLQPVKQHSVFHLPAICRRWESNPHSLGELRPERSASANSATSAGVSVIVGGLGVNVKGCLCLDPNLLSTKKHLS